MSHLTFRSDFLRYIEPVKSVHVVAEHAGRPISILITRRVIEYLADANDLDRDQSFTTVVRNKECLQRASERAIERYGDEHAIAVELADVKLAGLKAPPMVVSRQSELELALQAVASSARR
jgi:hypothetical protein